jgi:glyoxylase-like metal-dependent hydrolase (beta-lactamase superfamily II)
VGLPAHLHVLLRGWLSSNSILFDGPGETAIIDSGYAAHAEQTLELVEATLQGRTLDRLLNTHLHSDHCGGNAALQARYPALRTLIPPGEAEQVRRWDEDALSYRATGQICPRFRVDDLLEPGREVMLGGLAWQVHAAKGHDPHSVILFEPGSRTLISADALWENGFGIVFPELRGEPSFDEVAATLDLIEALAPLRVVPGHGRVFDRVAQSLSAARSRLDAWATDPTRHARHALKVLLKFKLLEWQDVGTEAWQAWLLQTPQVEAIRARFFPTQSVQGLCGELLDELVKSGAAEITASRIRNR